MPKIDYVYTDPTENASGSTPYGTYDSDVAFQSESLSVCKFVARRLGHPVMQLEFDSGSIYAMFEEAISEYSSHINNYNMKNWLWNQVGSETTSSVTSSMGMGSNTQNTPHMGTSFILSDQYGQAAQVGGDATLYSGSITLSGSQQMYDLSDSSATTYESAPSDNDTLEVQRVFNYGPSAMTRFYDPFAGSFEQRQMLDAFGFGNVAPAVSFILRPVSYDVARAQAIETNDKVRKSNYSFELQNNKLRIFPIPSSGDAGSKIYFHYYKRNDLRDTSRSYNSDKSSDPSNVPYKFITYSEINSNGRQWIRKYCLALSKELLGIIRSKYASMPVPNGDVTLDGEGLKAEGREEKQQLLDELKEFLDSVTLTEQTRQEQEQADANSRVLSRSPLEIYIG
jgi:hypothetical protein